MRGGAVGRLRGRSDMDRGRKRERGVSPNGLPESVGRYGWVGSRIMCVCEKEVESKVKIEKFWEDLGQLLKKFENMRRIFLLGDMNVKVGGREIRGVVGGYGVEGMNEKDNT